MSTNYDLVVTRIKTAGMEFAVERLRDFEKSVDAMFAQAEVDGATEITEEMCPYFGTLRPSTRALSERLGRMGREGLESLDVLEMGCGLALPSMVAARFGARVTATDYHGDVPRFLERNKALNGIDAISYQRLDWRRPPADLGRFDLIMGSDVLYDPGQAEIVAGFIEAYLKVDGRALLTDPGRYYLQDFTSSMTRRGFTSQTEVVRAEDDQGSPVDVFVLEFVRSR